MVAQVSYRADGLVVLQSAVRRSKRRSNEERNFLPAGFRDHRGEVNAPGECEDIRHRDLDRGSRRVRIPCASRESQ